MENIFSFNMCKKCGKISFFSKNKCPYCNTDMDKLEQKIDLAFISDMEQYIAQIYKQYYEKESYDKKACKNREKMDAKKLSCMIKWFGMKI